MVQGYAQANTPHPSGWRPDFGIQGGDSKGSNATQWVCPNSSYHLHEQWRVYQTEELKLREKAYLTMEDSEKNRYIEFLIQQKEERDGTIADKDAFIKNLQDTLDMLKSMHESDSKKIDEMLAKINDLTAQLKKQ